MKSLNFMYRDVGGISLDVLSFFSPDTFVAIFTPHAHAQAGVM